MSDTLSSAFSAEFFVPDVTLILNVHREAKYVARRLASLDEAAAFAAASGISTELLIVFDKTDALTTEAVFNVQTFAFTATRHIHVDHGSLGLARNAGLRQAKGKYVFLHDADDLISFNSIDVMFKAAESKPKSVWVPEYVVWFGEEYCVGKYFDTTYVRASDFVYHHPYISNIFVARTAFDDVLFEDLRLTEGFAYEDWHLNCELRARGYFFGIAPKVALYYRRREGSLSARAATISTRQIPHSSLHDVALLPEIVAAEETAHTRVSATVFETARSIPPRDEFLNDPTSRELLAAANRIDPGISTAKLAIAWDYMNLFPRPNWGDTYTAICSRFDTRRFSDIVLLPSFSATDQNVYVRDTLKVLAEATDTFHCLYIAIDHHNSNELEKSAPGGNIFLDLCDPASRALSVEERELIVLRLVLALALAGKGCRLHLSSTSFSKRWFEKFAASLHDVATIILYRLHADQSSIGGLDLAEGFGFISDEVEHLDMIVTDCLRTMRQDLQHIGAYEHKWHWLYPVVDAQPIPFERLPNNRLMLSVACGDSRAVQLAQGLLHEVSDRFPQVKVVLHSASLSAMAGSPSLDMAMLTSTPAGTWPDSSSVAACDALIHLDFQQEVSKTVLEVMGQGRPVIAVDTGRPAEFVRHGSCGMLVRDTGDDGELLDALCLAIENLYRDWPNATQMGSASRSLIEETCSRAAHRVRVHQIFAQEAIV